jgi:hypothetical protein
VATERKLPTCPEIVDGEPCGEPAVGTVETVRGVALVSGLDENGEPIYGGETRVDWDSQESARPADDDRGLVWECATGHEFETLRDGTVQERHAGMESRASSSAWRSMWDFSASTGDSTPVALEDFLDPDSDDLAGARRSLLRGLCRAEPDRAGGLVERCASLLRKTLGKG